MIAKKKVDAEGRIADLGEYANEEVFVVRTPKPVTGERAEKVAKALDRPLSVLDDLRRFVVEHRDLTRRQVSEFTARYGNPAEKAREYAKHFTPEDFRARVNELNALVEKRLETISQDLEKRYDDLEREVEQAIERVFGSGKAAQAEEITAPVREVDVKPVDDAPAKPTGNAHESSGKNAKRKKPSSGK